MLGVHEKITLGIIWIGKGWGQFDVCIERLLSLVEIFQIHEGITKLVELLEAYDPARAKELLYQLFDRLQEDFNGSMFETDLEAESETIREKDITTLCRFLHGHELDSEQCVFGFWAFDFSVIPVETISAIYEKVKEELKDPIQYFVEDHGMYSVADLMKAPFILIDVAEAADDAVASDGWAHFVSLYDGNYEETANGVVYFRE